MRYRLIIEGNAAYEIDEECVKNKQMTEKETMEEGKKRCSCRNR